MEIDKVFAASRFGMAFERLRLEAAAQNVATANVPLAEGAGPVRVSASVDGGGFERLLKAGAEGGAVGRIAVETDPRAVRIVHDPSDPAADANGDVRMPGIQLADEMTTLVSAGRAYEANVKALAALRDMLLRALEIGGNK